MSLKTLGQAVSYSLGFQFLPTLSRQPSSSGLKNRPKTSPVQPASCYSSSLSNFTTLNWVSHLSQLLYNQVSQLNCLFANIFVSCSEEQKSFIFFPQNAHIPATFSVLQALSNPFRKSFFCMHSQKARISSCPLHLRMLMALERKDIVESVALSQ